MPGGPCSRVPRSSPILINPAPFSPPFALPGRPYDTVSQKNDTVVFGFVQNEPRSPQKRVNCVPVMTIISNLPAADLPSDRPTLRPPGPPKITLQKDARIRVLLRGTLPGSISGRDNGKRGYWFSRRRSGRMEGVGNGADRILRRRIAGVVQSGGRGKPYRIPVSTDMSRRTVSPLLIVTVCGSSGLPPIPWCGISTTYVPGAR